MSEYHHPVPTETQIALAKCFSQIRLARATELAQSGRLLEAEALLLPNAALAPGTHELDLLARIAARQGRFAEARHRWSAALQIDPDNETYRRCLEQLTPAARIVRLLATHQDTLLNALVWATVAFALAVCTYVFKR